MSSNILLSTTIASFNIENQRKALNTWVDAGFDIFFDKEISHIYPESDFCLGQPTWGYWIVYIPIIRKITV